MKAIPNINIGIIDDIEYHNHQNASFSSNVSIESELADRNELGDFFVYDAQMQKERVGNEEEVKTPRSQDESLPLFKSP